MACDEDCVIMSPDALFTTVPMGAVLTGISLTVALATGLPAVLNTVPERLASFLSLILLAALGGTRACGSARNGLKSSADISGAGRRAESGGGSRYT